MNCVKVISQLDDWLDRELPQSEAQRVAEHIDACPRCEAEMTRRAALLRELRAMPVPVAPIGFAERVLANATRKRRVPRNGLAIAASLVLGLALGLLFNLPESEQGLPGVSMAVAQPREVNLVFDSARALEQVELTLRLPEGVELVGYPRQRELTWRTDLKHGRNQLTLPLVLQGGRGGQVVAELVHGGQRRDFVLQVTADDAARGAAAPARHTSA